MCTATTVRRRWPVVVVYDTQRFPVRRVRNRPACLPTDPRRRAPSTWSFTRFTFVLRSVKQTQHEHGTDDNNNKYNRTELISINGPLRRRTLRLCPSPRRHTYYYRRRCTYVRVVHDTRVRRRSVYVIMYTIYLDVAHRGTEKGEEKKSTTRYVPLFLTTYYYTSI